MGREQVLDLSDLQGGQASQDVGEIFLRVQAARRQLIRIE